MKVDHLAAKLVGLAAFLAISLLIFVVLFIGAGGKLPFTSKKAYTVTVIVPDPLQLVPNADVRRAGVKVGHVADIQPRGTAAAVKLELNRDQTPVYRDGTVIVRTKTLVGENYIELDRGHPESGALAENGTLALNRAHEAVALDVIFSSLDRRTRAEIRRNLRNLGTGFDGRGSDVNRLFAALRPTVADGGQVMQILRGQRRQVAALIDNTGTVFQDFDYRTQAVRSLAVQAKGTAEAVSRRDVALGQMIEELPPTLDQARTTATRLGSFSGRATPVIRDIRRAAPDLSAAVRYLRPAAGYSRLLFAQVPPLEPRLKPMLHRLRTFSVNGQQLAISTGDILRQLDPFVAYLRPFKPELGAMFANVGAATDFPDALGNTARTHLVFSDSTYSGASPDMRKLIDALVAVGGATVAPREGTNPYPAPGSGEKPEPFKGPYPRVQPER